MKTHGRYDGWRVDTILEISGTLLIYGSFLNLKINSRSKLKLGKVGLYLNVELDTISEDVYADLK